MFCNNCGNQLQSFNKFCPRCGVPVNADTPPAPSQPTPQAFQPSSSFGDAPRAPLSGSAMGQQPKKSGCGRILLILFIVLALVGGGIAATLYYYVYPRVKNSVKSSEAYSVALAALKNSPKVKDKLGEIKDTGFPLGSFSEDADGNGAAVYSMSVEGTKASGRYNVVMKRQNRKWRLMTGNVTLDGGGESINVASAEGSLPGADESDTGPGNSNERPLPPPPLPPKAGQGVPAGAVSGGVLNGKAIDLPQPAYPPVARAAHASGNVVVQVLVDEDGEVISARAVSGHPLLQAAAVAAAKKARFTPMMLGGSPVKVSGLLNYSFEAQ